MTSAYTHQKLPYPGPQTFQAADQDYFFGRDREAAALSSFLIVEPLVLFAAQSGAGKSSLINARIKPQFADKGFEIFTARLGGHSTVAQENIDNIYVYNLLSSLKKYNQEDKSETDVSHSSLNQLAKQSLLGYFQNNLLPYQEEFTSSKRPPRLLIIDQFEEIVTTYPAQWQHRSRFFSQLNQLVQADSRLWVLLTMREDHVAALDPYLYLLKNRLRARFYMERLETDAAIEAIEKPADKAGRPFTPEATHMLLDSLRYQTTTGTIAGQFIEPLQLQVVCYELWQKLRGKDRSGERITPENLTQSFVDLDHAVKEAFIRFYEHTVQSVAEQTNVSEFDIRYWFEQRLIVNMQMRGAVYKGETHTADLPNEAVSLLNERFLLHSETYASSVWYELIHDRFVSPVIEANKTWYKQADNWLFATTREWDRRGRKDANALLTADQLKQLEEAKFSGLVAKFVKASHQQSAEETLRGVHKNEKAHRRRIGWYVGALGALVVLLIAALVGAARQGVEVQYSKSTAVAIDNTAVAEANRAKMAADEANAQADAAATSRAEAVAAQSTAVAASTITINEAEAASTASAMSEAEQAIAETASHIAATEEAKAAIARNDATEQENLAEAARDQANAEAALAESALQEIENQRELVLAQSLAINTLNVIRSNNDTELATLLALEANKLNQEQTADDDIDKMIQQTFLNIFAQPYFNVTLQEGHESPVEAMAFVDDGRTLVSAGLDGTIRLWDLDQPELPNMPLSDNDSTTDFIRITPDGRTLVAASRNGVIQVWRLDVPNPMPVQFTEQKGDLLSLAVSPDGQEIAVSVDNDNERIRFWPLQESGEPMDADGITSRVKQQHDFVSLIYAPDGSGIYTYDPSRTTSSIIRVDSNTLDSESYPYLPLVYSPDGEIAAYYNNIFEVFRIATANRPSSLFVVDERFTLSLPAAFNHNNTLFADTEGEVIRLWQLHKVCGQNTITFLTELRGHSSPVSALVFAPDGTLASADASGDIRLWYPNPASTTVSRPASQIAFSPTNEQVAWLEDGQLYMQSFDDFSAEITATTVFTGYDVHLNSLAFSPDGSQIAAGGGLTGRGVVYVWQVGGGVEPTAVLPGHTRPVQTVAFAPDGQTLASGSGVGEYNSGDDTVLVWDLENPSTPKQSLPQHTERVNEVQFSPDGHFLASASDDGHVFLWRTSDYSLANELTLLTNDRALSLAFSRDGLQLAVGAGSTACNVNVVPSGNIYVWSMNHLAKPPLILPEHNFWVNDLAFASNDDLLVSGSADGVVRLWQFASGLPTSWVLVGHEQGVDSVAFAPDGRLALADGQIVQLYITPEQLLARGCTLVHRNLSWGEWRRYLDPNISYVRTCPELPKHPTVP